MLASRLAVARLAVAFLATLALSGAAQVQDNYNPTVG